MPYIPNGRRLRINKYLEKVTKEVYEKGDLTYLLYKCVLDYMKSKNITFKKGIDDLLEVDKGSYTIISEAISTLNDAEHELRRRFLDKYEQRKIFENGDIE